MHDPAAAGSGKFYPGSELFSPLVVFAIPRHANQASYFLLGELAVSFLACCVQVTSIGENRPREKCLTSTYDHRAIL